MTGILEFISETLEKNEIPYEYGEWTQQVRYPYFVGTYTESEYRYEDACTTGMFTLDGWSRESKAELVKMSDKIKGIFEDLAAVVDDQTYYIRYNNSDMVPSGEEGLFRISIVLNTSEWKGE